MADDAQAALVSIAVEPVDAADGSRLTEALRQLMVRAARDPETGELFILGKSEDELGTVIDRLSRNFKIETLVGRPNVQYREAIRHAADHECKFVRQIGDRGHYAHVRIRIEPLPGNRRCEFISRTDSGGIPPEHVRSIEVGIFEAMQHGVLAGYPFIDVRVILLGGSYHEIDSSELAFKTAASMAFKEAARGASPVILEPVMSIEVVTPNEFVDDVIGDLRGTRGAVISDVRAHLGGSVIVAEARLARTLGFSKALQVVAQARATFTMNLKGYAEIRTSPGPDGNEPASMAKRVA